jgi:hypothetical protein
LVTFEMAQDLEVDPESVCGIVTSLIDCQRRLERCILRTGPEHRNGSRPVAALHDERGRLLHTRHTFKRCNLSCVTAHACVVRGVCERTHVRGHLMLPRGASPSVSCVLEPYVWAWSKYVVAEQASQAICQRWSVHTSSERPSCAGSAWSV